MVFQGRNSIRCIKGFRPPKKRRAKASLTIVTGGIPSPSLSLKKRPCARRMPKVRKYSGETTRKIDDNSCLLGYESPGRRKGIISFPSSGADVLKEASETPGIV